MERTSLAGFADRRRHCKVAMERHGGGTARLQWNDTSQAEATCVALSAVDSCICSDLKGCGSGLA
eukprot:1101105-Rhodomonas_salina.1